MTYCTPWGEEVCAKMCESIRTPFPVRPEIPLPLGGVAYKYNKWILPNYQFLLITTVFSAPQKLVSKCDEFLTILKNLNMYIFIYFSILDSIPASRFPTKCQ